MIIIHRPWGWMFKILDFKSFWIKFLHVKGETSLQYHLYRSELTIGSDGIHFNPYLSPHRLRAGNYIEFAWGDVYESDVVRLADKYGRS